ncbi:MAG: hypothetical protein AB9834_11330 [Lentimicrobium sp.]
MNSKNRPLLFLIFLLTCLSGSGQYYDIGQAPASIRWEKIETGNFSIVYPAENYQLAKIVASQFSSSGSFVASPLGAAPRKTPLLLHTRNAISNAYAIWAPRRIEILTTPPQDIYAQPWIQQLALHEYRHIVQLSSLDQGFTRVLGYLFGQQAVAISTGLFIPSWFLEGDAVASETSFSYSGRGRVPSFSMPLRAQLSEKGAYSYPKASLGSYRDFVPDIYTTGYHIVATSGMKYGHDLWKEAMNTVARKPWTITPFNRGLKNISGLNKKGLYNESMASLNDMWKTAPAEKTQQIIPENTPSSYTNYLSPHKINDSVIVALKTSFGKSPQIVEIDRDGKENVIQYPGYMPDENLSFGGGVLSWAEYRPHIRWETVSYTDIVLLNLESGKKERFRYKGRFYAPVVSQDGKLVAAVRYMDSGECCLTVLNNDSLTNLAVPNGLHASIPSWSPDGKALVFVVTGDKGKAIARISTETGRTEYLTPFSFEEISNPVNGDSVIFYTGTSEQTSQIFSLNPENGQKKLLTNVAYGADNVSISGDSLIYNDYTADGYRIAIRRLSKDAGLIFTGDTCNWPLAEALSAREPAFRFSDSIPVNEYARSPYRKSSHLFGFHSWAPLYVDIGGETVRPGVSAMSQNLLSTMFITAGYDYNVQEEAGMLKADISWKGWFPVLNATFSQGRRASSTTGEEGLPPQRFTWNETNLDLSVSQSLNTSRGLYNSGLSGALSYNFSKVSHDNSTPDDFVDGNLAGQSYRFYSYLYRRQATRDLAPSFGYNFEVRFRHTPFGQLKAGNITGLQAQLFLPGLFINHSLLLYAGYQESNPEDYRFSNIISTSRGYTSSITGNKLFSLKFSYRLPLLYPDFHIGGLLYVKRIRANAFYDLTSSSDPDPASFYNSIGLDLVSDFHLLGLSIPISAGIRTIYMERDGSFVSSLLFSMNFYDY